MPEGVVELGQVTGMALGQSSLLPEVEAEDDENQQGELEDLNVVEASGCQKRAGGGRGRAAGAGGDDEG